jgi:NADH-quinone oxidoreductase subunit F
MLKTREDLIQIRSVYAGALKRQTKKLLVCAGTGCVSSGALEIFDRLEQLMKEHRIACSIELTPEPHEDSVGLKQSGCHGFCELGPLLRIEPQGWLYTRVQLSDCDEIIEKTVVRGEFLERLAYQKDGKVYQKQDEIPFY